MILSFFFWSDEDASFTEKAFDDGGERFFVGRGREVGRYKFQTYHSEIESNGCEILVRSEQWNEKVD